MNRRVFRRIGYLVLSAAFLAAAAAPGYAEESRMMLRIDTYRDGSRAVTAYRMDPDTGAPVKVDWAEGEWIDPDAVTLQSAVVTRSWHLPYPALLGFKVTKDAKPHKGKIQKLQNKYINQRRGTKSMARAKTTVKVVNVKPMSSFSNPALYYLQLDWDKNSTVVVTSDNQFFKDPFGTWLDPEIISTTRIFASAAIYKQGGKWRGTYWIVEADVYFRTDFFSLPAAQLNRIGTGSFRMAYGFLNSTWSHDYLSVNAHHVTSTAFNNKASAVWRLISEERDRFFYQDRFGDNWTPSYHSTPRLLPHENEVIDIGDYDLPVVDSQGRVDLGKTPILFLTNLKAYDGAKKLTVRIFRVTDDDPPKNIRIVTLIGNTMRYPDTLSNDEKLYASIFLNQVRLGRQADLIKLRNAVSLHGKLRTLDGRDFQKALRIKVAVNGRLEEGGKKKTVSRLFWLVDTVN